jgi:Fic family protein
MYTDIFEPLKKLNIASEMLRAIAGLDEFKGRWQALGTLAPDRLSALRRVATIESVGSSTRIEGAKLSDAEVDRLLSGLNVRSFRSRDEQEVAGYAQAMELVFSAWKDMVLTENHIKQLHGSLLRHSDKDERHRGHYKTVPNHVEAFDADGKSLGVVFQTATPFDTPRLMEELVQWTAKALKTTDHHPLLVIGVFVVRFLAVHPFQDGNGRLARVLTTLLLLRAGYSYVLYSSLERIIEENKEEYYRSLRRAQATLDTDESQLQDWLLFFLRCLIKQKDVLSRKVEQERIIAPLAPLDERLLRFAREHGRITLSSAAKLTRVNRNTLKAHLRTLVQKGRLRRVGQGRASAYEAV